MFQWLLSISTISIIAALLSFSAVAQNQYVAGQDYIVIENPVRTSDPDKIEVTEVFWYGCSHCNTFEPLFQQWAGQQADDIAVVHSPAMWNKNMRIHAHIFYTAKVLGIYDKVHQSVYDAMHKSKKRLLRAAEIFPLFEKHGIERAKFDKTFQSFGVKSMVQQADARARSYGISGTPKMVVNGKYRISSRTAGSHARMLQVVDYLIAKERTAPGS